LEGVPYFIVDLILNLADVLAAISTILVVYQGSDAFSLKNDERTLFTL